MTYLKWFIFIILPSIGSIFIRSFYTNIIGELIAFILLVLFGWIYTIYAGNTSTKANDYNLPAELNSDLKGDAITMMIATAILVVWIVLPGTKWIEIENMMPYFINLLYFIAVWSISIWEFYRSLHIGTRRMYDINPVNRGQWIIRSTPIFIIFISLFLFM